MTLRLQKGLFMRKEHAPKNTRQKQDADFEIAFYEAILQDTPMFIEALVVLGDLYTKAGLWQKGLDVDLKLSRNMPRDTIPAKYRPNAGNSALCINSRTCPNASRC